MNNTTREAAKEKYQRAINFSRATTHLGNDFDAGYAAALQAADNSQVQAKLVGRLLLGSHAN